MSASSQMTQKERMLAAINKQEVDRVPVNVWGHLPEVDQDPISLAETQLEQALKYKYDFIKFMPDQYAFMHDFGLSLKFYCTPTQKPSIRKTLIKTADDLRSIPVLKADYGTLGRTVSIARYMQKFQKQQHCDIPCVASCNDPLTTIAEMVGTPETFKMMKEEPQAVHEALEKMTQTTINYIKGNIEYGVSGFLFTSRFACKDYMTWEEYEEFGKKYDLQLFEAYKDITWINIIHIHGPNTYWNELIKYPGNIVNWHDTWVAPTLQDARKMTDKCLFGGLNEKQIYSYTPDEVKEQARSAIKRAGRIGFILGTGCGAWPTAPEANMYAASEAVIGL